MLRGLKGRVRAWRILLLVLLWLSHGDQFVVEGFLSSLLSSTTLPACASSARRLLVGCRSD